MSKGLASPHFLPMFPQSCEAAHSLQSLPSTALPTQHCWIRIMTRQLSALTPDHSTVPTLCRPSSFEESLTQQHMGKCSTRFHPICLPTRFPGTVPDEKPRAVSTETIFISLASTGNTTGDQESSFYYSNRRRCQPAYEPFQQYVLV